MTEIDPQHKAPEGGETGDANLDELLTAIERVAEKEIERNAVIRDNQQNGIDRAVASLAALRSINTSDRLLELALEAAVADPT